MKRRHYVAPERDDPAVCKIGCPPWLKERSRQALTDGGGGDGTPHLAAAQPAGNDAIVTCFEEDLETSQPRPTKCGSKVGGPRVGSMDV